MNSSSNGDGTAVAQTENPPTGCDVANNPLVSTTKYSQPAINEPAILSYANAVLNKNYATLDGISDQELQRVYVIVRLDVLLQNHPEARVFMCGAEETSPPQVITEVDRCQECNAVMDGIECPECHWLDLPF